MARDSTDLDDDDTGRKPAETGGFGGNGGLLHRRSYLKLAGITTAVTAGAAAATASAADDYDVVEARGQTITVDSGETWENKLIDMSTGGDVTISAMGTGWTIRNVGFAGKNASNTGSATFGIADTGGDTSTLENVYLGDGSTGGNQRSHGYGQTAVWVSPDHSGHIDIRRCNIQGFADNAIYGSAPARSGGGTIHIDECFAANCYVSHYRLGTAGSKVTNSVVRCDGNGYDGRGIWAWAPGPIEVENCVLEMNGQHYSVVSRNGAVVNLSNTSYDTGFNGGTAGSNISFGDGTDRSPSASVPDAVPTSAEEAASGGTDGETTGDGATPDSANDELERTILIDGDGADEPTRYEFAASGDVEKATFDGASIDGEDVVDASHVHGTVVNWRDAFRFGGDLEDLVVEGPARVLVDGEPVDPDEIGEPLPNELEVVGTGVPTNFEFSVDGEVELASDADPEDEATVVSGGTVEGFVKGGVQRFRFSGGLSDVTFGSGEASIYVNGERVDLEEYLDRDVLPHVIVFDGGDADGPTTYSFEIDGAVAKSDYRGASIDPEDALEGRTVRGAVGNWRDAYWFEGDIADFRLMGEATVHVEYNVHDR